MRALWRTAKQPLRGHADWISRIDKKNREQGTSAPTLAAAWSGLVEMQGALNLQPALAGFLIEDVVVEAQAKVDGYPGGRRNHDLVARGHLPNGDGAVVCVEAKAGEPLGLTIVGQRAAAKAAKQKNANSNAPQRVTDLVDRFVRSDYAAAKVGDLRYQLLTAIAGTISDARRHNAVHAVLMVHEFRTDERETDMTADVDRALRAFCEAVFAVKPPSAQSTPWCFALPQLDEAPGVNLYLARAVTDLRTETLEAQTQP